MTECSWCQRVCASLKLQPVSNPTNTLSSRPLADANAKRAVCHARGVCRTVSTRLTFYFLTVTNSIQYQAIRSAEAHHVKHLGAR